MTASSKHGAEITDATQLRHRPGPEAEAAFDAWWLRSLAERNPGRRFRLIPVVDRRADVRPPEEPRS